MHERPEILATFEVEELVEDAALCVLYKDQTISDERAKGEIKLLDGALERLSRLRRS